ncbi:MAG: hypothetical protein ACU833_05510 [Gammaproteobacteria bacterium]
MKKLMPWLLVLFCISGCSENEPENQTTNPWEDQIRAMEQTRQVEQLMLDSAAERRSKIDEGTR